MTFSKNVIFDSKNNLYLHTVKIKQI